MEQLKITWTEMHSNTTQTDSASNHIDLSKHGLDNSSCLHYCDCVWLYW